jgi:hypothetical protein
MPKNLAWTFTARHAKSRLVVLPDESRALIPHVRSLR